MASTSSQGSLPDHSIQIAVDRGGTFTDVYASWPDESIGKGKRKEQVIKLLSVDPNAYEDAPTEGTRRVLEIATGLEIQRGKKLETSKIDYIRLSTTVATNALLERKGARHAFVVTKGFKDLLRIGNQSRPDIFALNIQRPKALYERVVEVDERVTLEGHSSDPKFAETAVQFDDDGNVTSGHEGEIKRGVSGEAVQIMRKPNREAIRKDLQVIFDEGIRALAICFVHSYTFPDHEEVAAEVAKEIGFKHISVSSRLSPQIKMVPRATSSTADAYLTPVLREYLDGFFKGFDDKLVGSGEGARVEFMTSEGGLVEVDHFSGLKSILSGPAGGVVAYSLTSWDAKRKIPAIGFDMGGTSTDVSRFDGRFETVYETTTAGISIQSPQLDINTVAAGGGSCLAFRNGLFTVGPESAGANPGPTCYRKEGPLATTDANLVLGRLLPDYFPKIFGPSEDQALDVEASKSAFEKLRSEINDYLKEHGDADQNELSLDEVAYGFVKIANETMARPIRQLTEARGFATAKHVLASFGGAGGQHAVEMARSLGMTKILIHIYSSILSAYGMALADRTHELQEPFADEWNEKTKPKFVERIDKLKKRAIDELKKQGFKEERIAVDCMLNMRYQGSDTSLMTLAPTDGSNDYLTAFEKAYEHEFGFLLEDKGVFVDDVRVRGVGKSFDTLGESVFAEVEELDFKALDAKSDKRHGETSVYFEDTGRVDVPVFRWEKLEKGDLVKGPAIVVDGTQTIVLDSQSEGRICSKHILIELR